MPDLPISGLPELLSPTSTDVFAIVNGGITKKTTVQSVSTAVNTIISSSYVSNSTYNNFTSSYNTATSSFGVTPFYASFFHSESQFTSAPNTPTPTSMSSTDISRGIIISGSTYDKIKFASGGFYDIQFSAQMAKTTGTSATAYFWLRKNGTDIPWTNTGVTLAGGSNDVATPAWNFFISASANDFYQLMWSANTTNPYITASLSVGGGPAIPSLILTVNRVG